MLEYLYRKSLARKQPEPIGRIGDRVVAVVST
jgi:hypothetical protein